MAKGAVKQPQSEDAPMFRVKFYDAKLGQWLDAQLAKYRDDAENFARQLEVLKLQVVIVPVKP